MTEKITRRTVTAAAWTVPILAACAPAPAFAASGPSCTPAYGKRQNAQRSDRWDFIVYPGCVADGKARLPDTVHINGVLATLRTDSKGRSYYDLRKQEHSYTFRVRIVVGGMVTFDRVVDVRNSQLPA